MITTEPIVAANSQAASEPETAEVRPPRLAEDVEAIADAVSESYGRRVSGDNVAFLIEEKLRPLGVLALVDGSTPELEKRAPLLALRHRKPVLSEAAVMRA